MAQAF